MNRTEFLENWENEKRSGKRVFASWFIFALLAVIGLMIFGGENENYRNTLFASICLLGLIGSIVAILVFGIINSKKSKLRCSKCGKNLTNVGIEIAVATGNCSSCGEKFLDD